MSPNQEVKVDWNATVALIGILGGKRVKVLGSNLIVWGCNPILEADLETLEAAIIYK
ncbi:MAG: hypothetical protein R3294_09160 [Arenibacter troitsensis]|nr:hypothetical protein [Arenibacter troitsensis]